MARIFFQEWRASSSSCWELCRLPVLIGIFPGEKLLLAQGHAPFLGETLTKDQKVWGIYQRSVPYSQPGTTLKSHWLRLLLGMHHTELPALSSLVFCLSKGVDQWELILLNHLQANFYLRIYFQGNSSITERLLFRISLEGDQQILAHKNNVVHCLLL